MRKGAWKATFLSDEIYKKQPAGPTITAPVLYNLDNDPSERFDVSKDHPKVMEELTKIYEDHAKQPRPVVNQLDRI